MANNRRYILKIPINNYLCTRIFITVYFVRVKQKIIQMFNRAFYVFKENLISIVFIYYKKKTTKNKKEKISDRNWIDIKTEYLTMIFFAL